MKITPHQHNSCQGLNWAAGATSSFGPQIHFKCSSTFPPKLLQLGGDGDDDGGDDGDYNNGDQEVPLPLKLLQLDEDDDDDRAGDGDDM